VTRFQHAENASNPKASEVMMISSFLAAVLIGQAASVFMSPARYIAGTGAEDSEAIGGFATSDNLPTKTEARERGFLAKLSKTTDGLQVRLINGTAEGRWFDALDSNLHATLQAKDEKGTWQPIEYREWYWCGNSRHRVFLPARHEWKFTATLPEGNLKTRARWLVKVGDRQILSNELPVSIPATRFHLAPDLSQQFSVRFENGFAQLGSKA
jgi:hypothetical protein